MKYYAGLDVSLKETSVCILDEAGAVLRELKFPSHPKDLIRIGGSCLSPRSDRYRGRSTVAMAV